MDRGEEVPAAAIRETEEECGLKIALEKLLGVYSYADRTQVVIVYVARQLAGKVVAGDEVLETGFFSGQEMPWDELAFPSTVDALRDYFKGTSSATKTRRRKE